MKKEQLIFVLIVFFNQCLNGQDYVPFPTENVSWNVFYAGTCNDFAPPDTLLIRYAVHGDTIINEKQYLKLCIESGDTINPEIKAIGGLREINKKIYFIGETLLGQVIDDEYLLYDFTSKVSDTIKHDPYGEFQSVVLEIDSVLIGTSYRRRYKVNNHWFYHNPDYIIEGIGSVKNGLLGHITAIPTCGTHYWEHICFSGQGGLKYLNPSFTECFPDQLMTGIESTKYSVDFDIYPNPFSQETKVKYFIPEYAENASLQIFNLQGILIKIIPINEFGIGLKTLYKGKLMSGVYISRLLVNGHQVAAKRIFITE